MLNTQNSIGMLGKDKELSKKMLSGQKLPEGVMTFNEFCKKEGINSGMTDMDINMTNAKKAKAAYNKYLEANGVKPQDNSINLGGSIFNSENKSDIQKAIYC
ncbi:MAG: hypothetical protein PHV37_06705 [Candidatus Gastranaerophilales bacterium]|nr:hypothetical protein [Candidatus Gastranaerophilales bacterium]